MNTLSQELIAGMRRTASGERLAAYQEAALLKERGFNQKEAQEMLDAKRYSSSIVDNVLTELFNDAVLQNDNDTSSAKTASVMVCPNSYREVAPFVTAALRANTAKNFINLLACSADPILKVSNKSLASWQRLAAQAKEDSYALNILHNDLKPWVEEAMCASVLASRKQDLGQQRVASRESNSCVYTKNDKEIQVDLAAGTCTCDKFTKSHFATFGLACEHMIKFADTVSPFNRIKRAITVE